MILVLLAAVAVASVPLAGGDLRRLGQVQLHWLWLAPAALAVQVVILSIAPSGHPTLHAAIHVGTYALLCAFIWANRRLPGARLLGAGCGSNLAAIASNGGYMPQSAVAHRLSGVITQHGFDNSKVLAHPHLLWLGDIIPIPAPFGFQNVLSIGDCLLIVGMLVMLHRSCGSPGLRLRARSAADLHAATPGPAGAQVYADAVLAGALSAAHASIHLWRTGSRADSAPASRALAAFATCRRAADRLPTTDERVRRAQNALASLADELSIWPQTPALTRQHERVLMSQAGALCECTQTTTLWELQLPAREGPLRGALPA